EALFGKSQSFGHVQVEHRTPYRIKTPQCQEGANGKKQRVSPDAKQGGTRPMEALRVQMLDTIFARDAPCDGEGKHPQGCACREGKGLELGLGDVASENSSQQQGSVGCSPLDRLKASRESEWLPLLDH